MKLSDLSPWQRWRMKVLKYRVADLSEFDRNTGGGRLRRKVEFRRGQATGWRLVVRGISIGIGPPYKDSARETREQQLERRDPDFSQWLLKNKLTAKDHFAAVDEARKKKRR